MWFLVLKAVLRQCFLHSRRRKARSWNFFWSIFTNLHVLEHSFYTKIDNWKGVEKKRKQKIVGNKTKGRISKRVFQENKARQIFCKTKIYLITDEILTWILLEALDYHGGCDICLTSEGIMWSKRGRDENCPGIQGISRIFFFSGNAT